MTSVESETRDGEARITIGSAWQTDPDRLRIDATRRIEGAANAPLDELSVETTTDRAHGMTRTEVHCAECGGHLGHVFPDGPAPTGERYCMNGIALSFEPKETK